MVRQPEGSVRHRREQDERPKLGSERRCRFLSEKARIPRREHVHVARSNLERRRALLGGLSNESLHAIGVPRAG
jgi:hypothetical protein